MPHPALPVLLIALVAPAALAVGEYEGDSRAATGGAAPGRATVVHWAQMSVRERIVVRVPRVTPVARIVVPAPVRYKEKKGPKCVAVAEMGGAQVVAPGAVDLVLTGNRRLRAKLDKDCGPMDFYNGFYLRPAADGKVCADRDVIRMRSGASCTITTFKTLKPAR